MFTTDTEFEDEVRRIARLLWPAAEFGGAAIIEGRERDGVFEGDDYVHLVECTVSRGMQKAEQDGEKLARLVRHYEAKFPGKSVKGWFVTLHEPTADQRGALDRKRAKLLAVSYDQFRSRLVDARGYLDLRKNYAFGSVRDPETGAAQTTLDYVPLGILDRDGGTHTVESLVQALDIGGRFVLLGDYGAGKSSTMRELFLKAARQFWATRTPRFPVLLNLRDHHGQTNPIEVLERHARNIGFGRPSHLVRAWRAGYAMLMLDGFDEVATAGWAGRTKRLRDLRFRSMELVRNFVREAPQGAGLAIAGREHFFDNREELDESLGLTSAFRQLSLSEFSPEQVAEYLRKRGWREAVPEWLPSRPLLLGYLAARGLLEATVNADQGSSAAIGWDGLLRRVCERESEIEAGIDAGTVRRLIERMATCARTSQDGLGPLLPDQITAVFRDVCGYSPDDRGAVLLQRLPGLGGHASEDGARAFVDRDFAAVAAAGDVVEFIQNPYGKEVDAAGWQTALPSLGVEVAAHICGRSGLAGGKVGAALAQAGSLDAQGTLAADVLLTMQQLDLRYDGERVYVREAMIPTMTLSKLSGDTSRVELQDCVILTLDVEHDATAERIPRFVRCYVTQVENRSGAGDLPSDRFEDCEFVEFEQPAATTNAILELPLPLGGRVLLTLLKKLYNQRGQGRRESALYRGLDHRAREIVPDVIDLLRREGFAVRTRLGDHQVWLPSRDGNARSRALRMLATPNATDDSLLAAANRL